MKIMKENLKFAKLTVRKLQSLTKRDLIKSAKDFYDLTGLDSCMGQFCVTARKDSNDALSYDCRQCIFSYNYQQDPKGLYCLGLMQYKFSNEAESINTAKIFMKKLQKIIGSYYKDLTSKICDKMKVKNEQESKPEN